MPKIGSREANSLKIERGSHGTRIFIDGKEINGVKRFKLSGSSDSQFMTFEMETSVISEIRVEI